VNEKAMAHWGLLSQIKKQTHNDCPNYCDFSIPLESELSSWHALPSKMERKLER